MGWTYGVMGKTQIAASRARTYYGREMGVNDGYLNHEPFYMGQNPNAYSSVLHVLT